MSTNKSILILCTDNYQRQPRVLRTIKALKKDYKIIIAGKSDLKEHNIEFINLTSDILESKNEKLWHFNKPAFVRLPISFYYKFIKQKRYSKKFYYENTYWSGAKKQNLIVLQGITFDLIISHGIDTLPLAIKLADKKIPVIFNAHEYYEKEFEENENWKKYTQPLYSYLINTYLPKADLMFCVCDSIQNEYQKTNKIQSVVISNATKYNKLLPTPIHNPIRIIHHGSALRSRELERMGNVLNLLGEGYELTFMLVKTDVSYYEELLFKFKNCNNIKFVEPVAVNDISAFCNQFDIGMFILPPVNYNWENALPNKVFEYVQARLALAVSPNVNMRKFVNENRIGVVSDDYTSESMAEAIKKLTHEQIYKYKVSSNENAIKLSAEENNKIMLQSVKKLVN